MCTRNLTILLFSIIVVICLTVITNRILACGDGTHQVNESPNDAIPENADTDAPPDTNPAEGAEPVFLENGEFDFTCSDLQVKGRVLDIVITRKYRSGSEYNSQFGFGWDISYNLKVKRIKDPNIIIFLNGDNRKKEYTKDDSSNRFIRADEPGNYFDYDDVNDVFTYVKKHGTEYQFDIHGNLSAIVDRNGNAITFAYDSNGLMPIYGPSDYFVEEGLGGPAGGRDLVAMSYKLEKITDDLNREINFTYDSNGLLSAITDFADRTWTYTYDASNNLQTVTTPGTSQYPYGLTYTYSYDPNHNLLTATDPNGQVWLTNNYSDVNDRVLTQVYGDGTSTLVYNPDSNEATVTNRNGYETKTIYNDIGQIKSRTVYTDGLREGDPESYITSYEYYSNGLVSREILPAGNYVDYTYDENGNVLTIAREPNDGEPNIVYTYTYEPYFNFVKTITGPEGNVTTFTYDYEDANNGNSVGNLIKITYPEVSTPQGNKQPEVQFTYNLCGQLDTMTDPNEIITKYVYYDDANDANNFGHLWKVILDYNETNQEALNITVTYEYDLLGRVIKSSDPNGDITQFEYNNLDLLIKTTSPSPFNYVTNFYYHNTKMLSDIERVKTGDNQVTSYAYNMLDKLTKTTDPLGYVTNYYYDNEENLSDVNDAEEHNTHSDYDERGLLWKVTDANGNTTEYSYNDNGSLKQIEDPNGDITTYNYDGFDRLVKVIYPDDTNETYGYDKNGNVTGFKNRENDTILYEFDAMNRVVVKNRPDDPNINYTYDICGRLVEVDDGRTVAEGGGVTSYYYDRIGRLTDVVDPEDRSVTYEYNNRGLRAKLIYSDDSYIIYEYDAMGRLVKIEDDSSNTLVEYSYDELSRRTLLALGNDANAVYEYDLNNRLTKLTNNIDDTNSITFDYANYDKVGNRLSMKIDDANTQMYTYDEIYRLVFVDYNDTNSTSYVYDSLGNRVNVNENGSVTSYVRNSLNQYTTVSGASYSYDDNGNLTDDGTYKYYYDCENRLTNVNDSGDNPVASYKYDFKGRRVRKIVYGTPDVATKYCYDGDQIIAEYDGSNNLLRKFVYGAGIDEPIIMIVETGVYAGTYYYHFDGLGSVIALSNIDGEIKEQYSYDVFGQPSTASSVGNPYLFTGREYDSETEHYYYRARMYNPVIGRFLQTDPIGYTGGLNLYTYVGNNPVNWTDPYGLCKTDDRSFGEKLWAGDYVGTQYGNEALDWYAYQIAFGDAKWYHYLGGFFSALWVPESWKTTTVTLASGLVAAKPASQTGPWLGKIAYHGAHEGGPHQYPHLQIMIRRGISGKPWTWRIP